ncbi:MAG: nodulation protein NodN [Gammaproteobacteria bacterium CG22_combo_CG10-13_8_21_14_all_40_8]|nr:MAG: nodulation protein NodN [Gammaproteobacteria bacterium CG22_combo_CG10-13_8_21_14_all_40_8]
MKKTPYTVEELTQLVGQKIAQSDWMLLDQERIQEFGHCTDDQQWIHMDPERAKIESPFGGTIAHGFLTLSLLSPIHLKADYLPTEATQIINYGLDKVRFMTPVQSGKRVRGTVELLEFRPRARNRYMITTHNSIEIEGEKRPALTAELTMILVV